MSGSAAVPTTVDVYVNNLKIFEQNVDPGPFQIQDLPMIGTGGDATVACSTPMASKSAQTLPFFANPDALRPGVFEFSGEAGFARLNYALVSNDYDHQPVYSGTARYGLNRFVTLETHGEGGAGVINGGAGALLNLYDRASLDVAVAGSGTSGGRRPADRRQRANRLSRHGVRDRDAAHVRRLRRFGLRHRAEPKRRGRIQASSPRRSRRISSRHRPRRRAPSTAFP